MQNTSKYAIDIERSGLLDVLGDHRDGTSTRNDNEKIGVNQHDILDENSRVEIMKVAGVELSEADVEVLESAGDELKKIIEK